MLTFRLCGNTSSSSTTYGDLISRSSLISRRDVTLMPCKKGSSSVEQHAGVLAVDSHATYSSSRLQQQTEYNDLLAFAVYFAMTCNNICCRSTVCGCCWHHRLMPCSIRHALASFEPPTSIFLIATTLPVCKCSSSQPMLACVVQGAELPAAAVLHLPPDLFVRCLEDTGKGATT